MNEVVKYHNDLNKIKVPNLKELEQNLLMLILMSIKNTKAGVVKTIDLKTLQKAFNDFKNNVEIGEYLVSLRHSFFKADFEILIKEGNLVGVEYVNLFENFILYYDEPDEKPKSEWKNFLYLGIKVNPAFEYIVNELTGNFTTFELAEFIALSGKYAKTLYRLLKQFRNTGYTKFEWDEFKRIMDIPENYRQTDIDQFILKPALKELTKPRNLFDRERVPFRNLTYTKLKDKKARGRGGAVVGIEFRFEFEAEAISDSSNFTNDIAKTKNNYLSKDDEWFFIKNAMYVDSKVVFNLYDRDQNKTFTRKYTKEQYEKEIKPFIVDGLRDKIF